jgi:hypothetical protein
VQQKAGKIIPKNIRKLGDRGESLEIEKQRWEFYRENLSQP